jgi:hypothetical protein
MAFNIFEGVVAADVSFAGGNDIIDMFCSALAQEAVSVTATEDDDTDATLAQIAA